MQDRRIHASKRKPAILPMTMPAMAPPDSVVVPFPASDMTVTVATGAWRTRSSAGAREMVFVGKTPSEERSGGATRGAMASAPVR